MAPSELQTKVGQLFAVGFHGLTPSPEIKTLIHEHALGGIVLFKRNISDVAQLQTLTRALQEEARLAGHERPLFIGIDQENGLVTRISPPIAAQMPGPMALGATYSPELAYDTGVTTGQTLQFFGINMNYAPVCDVNSEPLNPVIGVRSPGDDPEFVGRFASATARGLREQKVVPSVKHFPGHGDTAVDSHYGLPVITKSRDELGRCELVPFRRAAAEGVESVMTAHISLPAIDDSGLPATLSPDVLNILRKDMQYDGMIITDCLEMDGIRATYGTEKGAVLSLGAGSDSIMICHTYAVQVAAIKQVCEAVQSGQVPQSRLDEAYRRVTTLKDQFLDWDTALRVQPPAHLAALNQKGAVLAKEIYARSVTLVRDTKHILPLSPTAQIVFLFPGGATPAGGAVDGEGLGRPGTYSASPYLDLLNRHAPNVAEVYYAPPTGLSTQQWQAVEAADVVVFVSINARESPDQHSLGLELPNRTRKLVAIAACSPYDFLNDAAAIGTYIMTYEPTLEAFSAATDILFGTAPPRGALPVGAPKPTSSTDIHITPYNPSSDFPALLSIWTAALPTYTPDPDLLSTLLHAHPTQHHLIARNSSNEPTGFALLYANAKTNTAHLAVLAVHPSHQTHGIGTRLLAAARASLPTARISLGSGIPRFWPGIPTDLPQSVQSFFVHRGFRLNPLKPRSVDLYQGVSALSSAGGKYLARAKQDHISFAPVKESQYEECLAGQMKNFSSNADWINLYKTLPPKTHPHTILTALHTPTPTSPPKQIAWLIALPPSHPILTQNWAFPAFFAHQNQPQHAGLIGCVGVDGEYRRRGVGLGLVEFAVEFLKSRSLDSRSSSSDDGDAGAGIDGIFVDWVEIEGWYEKVGFDVWRSYRTGNLLD
ncbi:putative beta-N-acetylglucosaminidase [Aspergillus taichungensis]|uniref:Putative beta-N-acetylglucosaminidase n=1 Tax=Aspergillus taichungensis TaxID=482145 RepID=A0A2J5HDC5_9EURO|nr:putative beta-N-acetylglucosaminidase [Aspergillus taichungensis]